MNVRERIARLEELLARVADRAAGPRRRNGAGSAAATPIPTPPAAVAVVELSERTEPAPVVAELTRPVVLEGVTPEARPRPAEEVESRERIIAAEARSEEREPEALPISVEPTSADTGERLVAASPAAAEPEAAPEISVTSVSEGPEVEVSEEEPPASSRRPIAVEPKLEELAFGEAAPAPGPHTPPPESGRQVAAAPVDLDFEGEFTGVRPREAEEVAITVVETASAKAAPAPLVGEPIRPEVSTAPAATFVGAPPAFKPSTFGELLDATLLL